jgi:hypothetical protein
LECFATSNAIATTAIAFSSTSSVEAVIVLDESSLIVAVVIGIVAVEGIAVALTHA